VGEYQGRYEATAISLPAELSGRAVASLHDLLTKGLCNRVKPTILYFYSGTFILWICHNCSIPVPFHVRYGIAIILEML
jgi:hypothetical protein